MIGDKFIFIDVPKTGSSSIISAIKESGETTWGPEHNHVPAATYLDFLGEDVFLSKIKIAVVRCPYDRMISIWKYYNKIQTTWWEKDGETPTSKDCPMRLGSIKYLKKITTFKMFVDDIHEKLQIFLHDRHNTFHEYSEISNKDIYNKPRHYNKIINNQRIALGFKAGLWPLSDILIGSQANMLTTSRDRHKCCMDYVLPFSRLSTAWEELCGIMGWSVSLPHINRSPEGFEESYDDDMREKVRQLYCSDFNMLSDFW